MKKILAILLLLPSVFVVSVQFATLYKDGYVGNKTDLHVLGFPIKVAVYGDSRYGDSIHRQIVSLIDQLKPHIVVHLGDMVNSGDNLQDWQTFFEIVSPLLEYSFFQPVKGNHEKPDVYYREYFGRYGLYNYWAQVGDWLFVFLDPDVGVDRLKKFLKSLDYQGKKVLIFTHYPLFSGGPHGETATVKRLQVLHETFKEMNVLAVFSGHDHNYQRIVKDGITYIVTGGGGSPLYNVRKIEGTIVALRRYHFVFLELAETLKAKVISRYGEILDEFEIIP
ncbi:metallophosphoesterase family protein [Pseudothermotoga thermarum]|uniref:Metallophosphoesterase n=1 Tax=Pseudothermotoga thermarum DSM 5069 TaxID=688269 RepID=F7YUU5_9THEM|nr:metallophosphoesterase [Pseudothermotoga thermarum]AEH51505.1 metallophosphoesterase [Pseudothermotoga thermarum DSM 5069]